MNLRSILPVALVMGGVLGFVYACSAPDPGAIVYVPRNTQTGPGPEVDSGTNPIGTGGTDGGTVVTEGGATTPPTTAFDGEGTYAAGTASDNSLNASHATVRNSQDAGIPNMNPAGMNCLDSACHAPSGGQAGPWTFAGTAYTSTSTPAGAGVEIRLIDSTTGKQCDSIYTDAQGNFFTSTPNAFPAGNLAGARNGTKSNTMATAATAGCNMGGCHAAGLNPMLQ